METRYRDVQQQDANGNRRTVRESYQEKVVTHQATNTGAFVSKDLSATFVPRQGARNDLMLHSGTEVTLDPAFKDTYARQREQWFVSNRRDSHQNTSHNLHIPGLLKQQHFQFVESGLSCWLHSFWRYIVSCFLAPLCGPCWLCLAKHSVQLRELQFRAHKRLVCSALTLV